MKIILLLSTISTISWSADFTKQVWSKGQDNYVITYQPSTNLLISLQCLNDELTLENSKCDAAKILMKKKSIRLPSGALDGGKNPGAVVCTVGLNKKILILNDLKNNENSFCVFDDGSMISAITLQSLIKE